MGELTGSATEQIVRLESVAESLADDGVDAAEFADRFAERLAAQAGEVGAVGVKSVAAYRTGLRLDPRRPSPAEVTQAAARWLAGGPGDAGWRMARPRPAAPHACGPRSTWGCRSSSTSASATATSG